MNGIREQLAPCPFCGGEAELDQTLERFDYCINGGPDSVKEYGWYVYCTKCDAGTNVINVPPSSPEEAIDAWNRRQPAPTVIRETIESALIFSRDTLKEHSAAHITDGKSVLAPEVARHDAALAWLGGRGTML